VLCSWSGRQDIKLENCCIWLVIYLNCTMMHGHTNLKFEVKLLRSIHFTTNATPDTTYVTHLKTCTCFSTHLPSSGSYYNKDVRTYLLIYVLFVLVGLIKLLVIKYIKCIKYINFILLEFYSILLVH